MAKRDRQPGLGDGNSVVDGKTFQKIENRLRHADRLIDSDIDTGVLTPKKTPVKRAQAKSSKTEIYPKH